jgi:hypothetical protein
VLPGVLRSRSSSSADAGAALLDLPLPRIASASRPNLALVDLDAEWEVGEDGYESRSENCCFAGPPLRGRVLLTSRPARSPTASGARRWARVSRRLRPARGRHALRRRRVRRDAHATGEVVFTTGMSGYQESMTDPRFARQLITFTYPHIGNYGVSAEAMESDRVHARRRSCARRRTRGRARRRARLAGLARRLRRAGDHGVDTRALVRTSATRARCAAASSRPDPSEAREDRRRAADGRADSRAPSRPSEPVTLGRRRLVARSTPGSSLDRAQPARARRRRRCTVHAPPRSRGDAPTRLPRQRPGDRPRSTTSSTRCASSSASGRSSGSASATSCSAGGRPRDLQAPFGHRGCQPPGQGPSRPGDRDQLADPRLRGGRALAERAQSNATSRCAGNRLRAGAAQPRQPLRPHVRGLTLLDVPGATSVPTP